MTEELRPERPVLIAGPYLFLVEGQDEVEFFSALLRHTDIGGVQVVGLGGKDQFPRLFPGVHPQLDHVRAYAVIRDADTSAKDAFDSVKGVLQKHGEPCPTRSGCFISTRGVGRRVGIYILPGKADRGMLEDLCLATVRDHAAMPCVDRFVDCLKESLPTRPAKSVAKPGKTYFPKNASKARAMAFLAAMHDEVHRVGEAAQRSCWDFDHPCLSELKAFLQVLVAVSLDEGCNG